MPTIDHGFALETVEQLVPFGATFVPVFTVAASNFVPGSTYLLVVTARVGGDAPLQYRFRLTRGGVEMVGSLMDVGNPSTISNRKQAYSYMTVFTAVAGQDIAFEMRSPFFGNATGDEIAIFWMRLEALNAGDFFFNEDDDSAAPTALTASFADFAAITFTPEVANEDWLVLSSLSGILPEPPDPDTEVVDFRINRDPGAEVAPFMSQAGESILQPEQWPWLLSRVFTLSAAPHTFTAQARESGAGTPEHHSSRIFALRLNAFLEYGFVWNETATPRLGLQGFAFHNLAQVNLTPSIQNDFLLLGMVLMDAGGDNQTDFNRLRLDGVVVGQGAPAFPSGCRSYSATDENPAYVMALENLTVAPHQIEEQVENLQATGENEDRSLVVLSMELQPTPPFSLEECQELDETVSELSWPSEELPSGFVKDPSTSHLWDF